MNISPAPPEDPAPRPRRDPVLTEITRLEYKPRDIAWMKMKAAELNYDIRFLAAVIDQVHKGRTIEQLRALKSKGWFGCFKTNRLVKQQVRTMLVQFVIKSADEDTLYAIRHDGWISWWAEFRLSEYCRKRKLRTNTHALKTA